MTMAQDGGKVVRLTHRPPLPPGNTPGTHFCWWLREDILRILINCKQPFTDNYKE
jgi:hypothetical protein